MGLSSKQVSSSSGLDWNKTLLQSQNLELPKPVPVPVPPSMKKQQQQNQQPAEPLKCPRCDSTNTKFCYYNNYNKSQPRHFCRACKRHWTKGGTLRNVPVGGGRKNKRSKKSSTTTSSNGNITVPTPVLNDQKSMDSTLYQSMLLPQQNLMSIRDSEVKDFGGVGVGVGGGMFVSSAMTIPQSQGLVFPFSTSSSFDAANPCSVSASNVYSYGDQDFKTMEEPEAEAEADIMPSTSGGGANTQLWEMPAATSTAMEMSNYWGWEDLDSLVSTDLNVPWDDSDIKP